MKNYYDELEVSKTSSKEIISKVYKILAKKYHPDTTKEEDRQAAEEKFKAISEAYEVLSDEEKRKKYDQELEQLNPTISYEEYKKLINERDELNSTLNKLKNSLNNNINTNSIHNTNQNINHQYTNSYNNSNSYNSNTNTSYTSKKAKYYYTNTGKPASIFDYFKYKVKRFFTNIIILILSIILAILIVGTLTDFNLFNFFI